MILALVSSGRSLSEASTPTKLLVPAIACRRQPSRRSRCRPRRAAFSNAVPRTVMHLLGVVRLDRGDGVAGVDRPGEGVLVLDRQDVADSASRRARRRRAERCSCRSWWPERRRRRGRPSASRRSARHPRRAGARGAARRRHGPCRCRRSSPAASATPPTLLPATSAWTSPSFAAAVTAASVASLICAAVMLDQDRASSFRHSQRLQLADQLVDRCRP